MLLLILGYYNPIVKLVTDHLLRLEDVGICIAVLLSCGLGIITGFLIISKVMKLLLAKYPVATYSAIVGFILGSIPTVYVSTAKDVGLTLYTLPKDPWHWIICALLVAFGLCLSLLLIYQAKRMGSKKQS
jgi:uncharacterized membrane protein